MDLACVRSYLNTPKITWEKLRHLRPFLLSAVRNKDIKIVEEFLNHKMWGKAYCDGGLIEAVAHSQWKDGWDLVVKKSLNDDKALAACLISIRPNPKLFNEVLDHYWSAYTDVPLRSKKIERFLLGVHQIALAAIRFNNPELYNVCKTKSAPYVKGNSHWQMSIDFSQAVSKYMCCWALDDIMRSSGQPHHFLAQFLKTNSFIVDTQQLLKLCHTLLEISGHVGGSRPSMEDPQKLINTLKDIACINSALVHNGIDIALWHQRIESNHHSYSAQLIPDVLAQIFSNTTRANNNIFSGLKNHNTMSKAVATLPPVLIGTMEAFSDILGWSCASSHLLVCDMSPAHIKAFCKKYTTIDYDKFDATVGTQYKNLQQRAQLLNAAKQSNSSPQLKRKI